MLAAVYIDLSGKDIYSYEKGIISGIRTMVPEILSLDLDHLSEPALFDYALRLLKDAARTSVIVESNLQHAAKVLPVAELIIKTPEKYQVFLKGENQWLEKICSGIAPHYLRKNLGDEDIIQQSSKFLKKEE